MIEEVKKILKANVLIDTITVGDMDAPIVVKTDVVDIESAAQQIHQLYQEKMRELWGEFEKRKCQFSDRDNIIFTPEEWKSLKEQYLGDSDE